MSIDDGLLLIMTCAVLAFTRQGSLVRSQYRPPPIVALSGKRKPAQLKAWRVFCLCALIALAVADLSAVPKLCPSCAHLVPSCFEGRSYRSEYEFCLQCPFEVSFDSVSINSNRSLTEHLKSLQRRSIVSRSTLVAVSL